jgi:diguanylate cyclase (GGDEF)-like protein
VSLIMIEIDHFLAYHERLGKPDADACLRAVSDAMKPIIHRPGDTLARYGASGKFGVVLGGTDAKGAMLLAERLRQSVEKLQKSHPASPSGPILTLSIGVAAAMPDREGAWQDIELIAMAENGLSRAKEAGRNRVWLDQASQPATSG